MSTGYRAAAQPRQRPCSATLSRTRSGELPSLPGRWRRAFHPSKSVDRGVAQPGRAPGSGPGGRRFESSLPDHSFVLALLKIRSNGYLYVGVTVTPSTEKFEHINLSSFAFSSEV